MVSIGDLRYQVLEIKEEIDKRLSTPDESTSLHDWWEQEILQRLFSVYGSESDLMDNQHFAQEYRNASALLSDADVEDGEESRMCLEALADALEDYANRI